MVGLNYFIIEARDSSEENSPAEAFAIDAAPALADRRLKSCRADQHPGGALTRCLVTTEFWHDALQLSRRERGPRCALTRCLNGGKGTLGGFWYKLQN
jgi:hypothetical protein